VEADGSEQYTHIQAAITAANTGDVVLVSQRRYVENVDFMGKTITVCSKEATTGDTTYIRTTIIDENRNGACVSYRNAEQNAFKKVYHISALRARKIPVLQIDNINDLMYQNG